ncbi:hypothetical protein ACFL3S_08405 [Gemmatimonadota bacterium]
MKRVVPFCISLFGLAACAGPGGVSPTGGLMYQVPEPAGLVYLTGDTTNIDIDAGAMGSFRMRSTSEATVEMEFARGAEGVQVTARFQDLNARMSQPMGGAISATEEDVKGDIVFTLDRKGKATVVTIPEVEGQAGQLANPHGLAYQFFPLLPGSAVDPGDTWTDTIQYEADLPEGSVAFLGVMTYVLQGDTTVDGMNLLHVTFDGEGEVTGSGITEGMDVIQTFSGGMDGFFLWDAVRGVMVATETTTDMSGTVEVPAAGMPPMPMKAAGTSRARLQGG